MEYEDIKAKEYRTYGEVTELLHSYHSISNALQKEKIKALIFAKMLPIIKRIAHTIARRSYDPIDDLVQAGSIGLLKAIDKYETSDYTTSFRVYAGYMIIGEMRHYIRDQLNMIKVPAYIQELTTRINSFMSTLTAEEVQELTSEDLGEVLNIPVDTVNLAMQVERRKKPLSLDALAAQQYSKRGYEETIANKDGLESTSMVDSRIILKEFLDKLPQDCYEVIHMYYFDGLYQKQIAEYLGITQMKVSRLMKKSFNLLHQMALEIKPELSNFIEEELSEG